MWQGSGSQGAAEVVSVRREQTLRQCLDGHLAARAKVNPPHPGEKLRLRIIGLLALIVERRKNKKKREERLKKAKFPLQEVKAQWLER